MCEKTVGGFSYGKDTMTLEVITFAAVDGSADLMKWQPSLVLSVQTGIRLEPGNREFPVRVKLPGKWHSNEGKTGKISFQYIFDRENDTKNRPKPGKNVPNIEIFCIFCEDAIDNNWGYSI